MLINVITFSAHLTNELTNKINEKYEQSVDDFFKKLSSEYKKEMVSLEYQGSKLTASYAEKYPDGSEKQYTNFWDLLSQEHKEEAKILINLIEDSKHQIRDIRNYLTYIATQAVQVNDKLDILSYYLDSYVKFFECLPDFIKQDKDLLLRQPSNFTALSEEVLYDIEKHKPTMNQKDIEDFVKANVQSDMNDILASIYALEFLVDF